MKRNLTILFALVLLAGPDNPGRAQETAPTGGTDVVYIIPIQGMIENALIYVIRRGVAEAEAEAADAIVFDMETPGGTLQAAEEIIRIIENVSVPTYTFVNKNAISAGAIISMATDHIYMAPGSKIGDALPIMMTPFGGPTEMPEEVQEKSKSYTAGMIRAAAQNKGHDPQLAEAMVRPEVEYKIGDEVIVKEGHLLTLTNVEAERTFGEENKPLLSKGTVKDIDALLEEIGLGGARTIEMQVTDSERLARWIAQFAPLFLMAGLLGIYIEVKTPGFGLPGILGVVSLIIFFWGHRIAGLAGNEEIILFAIGIALILAEIFITPGFGLLGLTGILVLLLALLMSMVQHYPGGPLIPSIEMIQLPVFKLGLSFVLFGVAAMVIGRFLPQSSLLSALVLKESTDKARGYEASDSGTSELLGRAGVTVSELRPSGTAQFGEQRLDVVTRGEFIDKDVAIRVVETHGNRIVVEEDAAI